MMPGSTPLGLRYPLLGEAVDAQSYRNLANDVDAALTTLRAARNIAMRTPTCSIGNDGTLVPSLAANTDGVMTFNITNWDTDGLSNLAVNNDRINLPVGIWWGRVSLANITGFATFTYLRVGLITPGFAWSHHMLDTVATSVPGPLTANGLIVNTGPGSVVLQMRIRYGGTGSANFNSAQMQVHKIRDIADF
jgi:hypothetical protein